ncbi:MAG: hypothetical protein LBI55_00675 [Oscillospiraceae bacterium]|jgi:lipopolysaccharide/colanic/teichoic acid biosynthesis glycosyltransferase|nr:hypothetical protein [Oscillospiraceae bacterium]
MQSDYKNNEFLSKKSSPKAESSSSSKQNATETLQKMREYDSNQILVVIQTIICTLIVVLVLFLKSTGSEFYKQTKVWYLEKINDSILVEDKTLEMPNDNAVFVNNTK